VARPTVETGGAHGELIGSERNRAQLGAEQRSDRAEGHAYAGSTLRPETRERTSSAGGRRLGVENREAGVERSNQGQARDRTATGGTERLSAPARPETQPGTQPERPTQQEKAVDPVQESGAPVPVPDTTMGSAPDSSAPGKVEPPE
jgi:hypothetical protein